LQQYLGVGYTFLADKLYNSKYPFDLNKSLLDISDILVSTRSWNNIQLNTKSKIVGQHLVDIHLGNPGTITLQDTDLLYLYRKVDMEMLGSGWKFQEDRADNWLRWEWNNFLCSS
jgi:hypothetical protein